MTYAKRYDEKYFIFNNPSRNLNFQNYKKKIIALLKNGFKNISFNILIDYLKNLCSRI